MAAFTVEDAQRVKQKAAGFSRKAKTQLGLKYLFSYLAQFKNATQLAFVNLGAELSSSTESATSSTGKLYAAFIKNRDASAVFAVIQDTASAATIDPDDGNQVKIPGSDEVLLLWPDGLTVANGITVRVDSSGSAAANPTTASTGFLIVGQ